MCALLNLSCLLTNMESSAKVFLAVLIFAIRADLTFQQECLPFKEDLIWNRTYTKEEVKNGVASQYRDGDIIIGLIISQHREGQQHTCDEIDIKGVQLIETVNMLIEKINANNSILPGVKLGTLSLDACSIDTHTVRMIVRKTFPYYWQSEGYCDARDDVEGLRPFAGFIGPGPSHVTILSSKILQVFKIPLVSYFSTSPELSDKNLHPYVFRTVPSDAHQAVAMMKFIQSKGWNYISVVYADTLYGTRAFIEIQKQVKIFGICIAVSLSIATASPQSFCDDAVSKLLEHPRARVVVLFAAEREAENMLQAAQRSLPGKDHFIWIGSDGWTSRLPIKMNDTFYITQLNRSIGFAPQASALHEFDQYFSQLRLRDRTGANSSLNPWFARFLSKQLGCKLSGEKKLCSPDDHLTTSHYETSTPTRHIYDAMLIFVQALNELHKKVCGGKPGLCPELMNCTLGTNKLATQLFPYIKNASITSSHGGIFQFDENHDAPPSYTLRTYDCVKEKNVCEWNTAAHFENSEFEIQKPIFDGALDSVSSICSVPCKPHERKHVLDNICCWTCVPCSSDEIVTLNGTECRKCSVTEKPNSFRNACKPLERHNLQLGSPFTIVPILVSTLGILLTICIAAIYIKHRDTPIVKSSSKELSTFVFVGSIICLLNGYVTIGGLNKASCAASRIILSIGPAFMYSGLLTKTVRIVIIFQSKNMLKKHWKVYIRPMPQIFTTSILIIFQVFLLTSWFLINPNESVYTIMDGRLYDDCSGIKDAEILIALAFPFILIVVCTVLATINRNVPSGFNETRYVGLTMYTTCVIWLAFVPIVLLNLDKVPLKVMTASVFLSLSAITVMTCLFVPRCYDIILRPERNTRKSVMDTNVSRHGPNSSSQGRSVSIPK